MPSRPKLTCTSSAHCGIPVVDPTAAYRSLADVFLTTRRNQSCISVPILAAAYGINAETMDQETARSALMDAYWRQRNFGEDAKLPSIIFYNDAKGTRKPLVAHTVRDLMATELVAGQPQIVPIKPGKNTSCVIVNTDAAKEVVSCLKSANENSPPAEACKVNIDTIQNTQSKPLLAKVLGTIKIGREEVTIPESSLAHIIPRSKYRQESSLGGDKSQAGCVLQFGVSIPAVAEEEVDTLSIKGTSQTPNSAVYSCAPDEKLGGAQIVAAHDSMVKPSDCSGSNLGWDVSGPILGEENTQPFAFLISIPSSGVAPVPFEVNLEISVKPKPGGDPGKATWQLTGICTR